MSYRGHKVHPGREDTAPNVLFGAITVLFGGNSMDVFEVSAVFLILYSFEGCIRKISRAK